jgi:hypothetical protein
MSLAFASAALARGETWPSSDLDGHVAMVEFYRQALAQGVLWPYDRASGGGMDALPYYAWPWELLLALLAQGLQLLGVIHGALWVCLTGMLATLMALPVSAAWCCEQAVDDGVRSRHAGHAGALAAWVFLATRSTDGMSGYGGDFPSLGLFEQGVGWNLLLILAGSLARPCDPARLDLRSGAMLSLVLLVHSMSALCAGILLLVCAWREPRRALGALGVGVCAGAINLAVVYQVHGEILTLPEWARLSGEDGVLALFDPLWLGQNPARALPGAACLAGSALLLAGARGCRRPGSTRTWAAAALAITLLGCLPLSRVLLPAASQTYRVLPVALVLGLVAGASQAPAWCRVLSRRVRPGLALAGVAALWCGLGCQQLGSWPRDRDDAAPVQLETELRALMPAGSRVLVADQIGWHRWMVERWKQAAGWESLGCFHPVVAPALVLAAGPATQALGIAMGVVAPLPPPPPRQASLILRDLGVEQVARRRAVGWCRWEDDFGDGWLRQGGAHYQVWSARTPAPRLELLAAGVVGISADLGAGGSLLPAYAAQLHARLPEAPRLVVLHGTRQSPPAAGGLWRGLISDHDDATPTTLGIPPLGSLAFARSAPCRDESAVPAVWEALDAALAGVPQFLRQLPAAATTPPPPAWRRCSCQWLDLQRCRLDGLVPGRPYLLRYGFSDGMACSRGSVLREACGMTVVIPRSPQVVITISCITAVVVLGAGISLASWALILAYALARSRGERRGASGSFASISCQQPRERTLIPP